MNRKIQIIFISTLLSIILTPISQAEEGLGRLFTTPKQRAMLEKLRDPSQQPPPVQTYEPVVIVDHSDFKPPKAEYKHEVIYQTEIYPDPEPVVKQEPEIVIIPKPEIPIITVNGYVKRSGGRSTVWVNGVNTNDGYFEPHHIKVNPQRIGHNHVHVEVDDANIGEVSLKVGQSLDPKATKITDAYEKMSAKPDIQ